MFESIKDLFGKKKKKKKKKNKDLEDQEIEEGGTHPVHEEYAKEGIVKK